MSKRALLWVFACLCALVCAPAGAAIVTGQVTDAATGNPLGGAAIDAFDLFTHFSASVIADGNGNYQLDVTGNPQVTASYSGYESQGQFVNGASTLNFALVLTGRIAGSVHSAGAALADVPLSLYDAQNLSFVRSAASDSNGSYTFDVPPGQYAVCVIDSADIYADQCYSGQNYPGPDGNLDFTTVALSGGQQIGGIDFDLAVGATISGSLHDSYFNAPIAQKTIGITLYSSSQRFLGSVITETDATGAYSVQGLVPGTAYFIAVGAYASNQQPNTLYTARLYGGGECVPSCNLTPAALTTVPAGGLSGVDFDLFPGRIVTGRVTDAQTGTGIAGVTLGAGEFACGLLVCVTGTAVTDANGDYTLAHLYGQDGVHVATHRAPGYIDTLWPNTPCAPSSNCVYGFHDANSIDFNAPDQIVPGIDFALSRGASVSGRVTLLDNPGLGVAYADVAIYYDDGQNGPQLFEHFGAGADGRYSSDAWAAGTYYVAAYVDGVVYDCQFYGAVACNPMQTPPYMGVAPGAQSIVIASPGNQPNVDIALRVDQIFYANFE